MEIKLTFVLQGRAFDRVFESPVACLDTKSGTKQCGKIILMVVNWETWPPLAIALSFVLFLATA